MYIKIEIILSKTLKQRQKYDFFDEKCVSFGSVEVAMEEDLVEILVSFSF